MRITILLFLAVLISACKADPKPTTVAPKKIVRVPKFDSGLAYAHIEKQLSFGTRVPGTASHTACKDWIANTMESYGWEVEEQNFTATVYTGTDILGTNVIAKFNPDAAPRILLAAHYDTRHIADKDTDPAKKNEPILGADDGASGVALLMSMAKTIAESDLAIGVDMVFFDLEDYGAPNEDAPETWALGSVHWAKTVSRSYKPKHAILVDMVGAKNATFARETYSYQVNPTLVDKIWKLAQDMGYGNYFVDGDHGGVQDDHISVINHAGIPMIDIIHKTPAGTFGDYHHTHKDNISIIDKRTLKAVGQVLTAVVFNTQNGKI